MGGVITNLDYELLDVIKGLQQGLANVQGTPISIPVHAVEDNTECSTTSTTPGDPTTGTTGPGPLTAFTTHSGQALVQMSAAAQNAGGGVAEVGVMVDGTTYYPCAIAGGSSAGTITGAAVVTGLGPGNHTYKAAYLTTAGTATFFNRVLIIQPL